MLSNVFVLAALSASAVASEWYSPAHNFGAMEKRQGGYYPTTHICGQGDTCAIACGPTSIECPSDAGNSCYDPSLGEHCCADGAGNSCKKGYYCTNDGAGTTYCCPEGTSVSECAVQYSLTVSLNSVSNAPIPTSGASGSPAATPVTTTSLVHVSIPETVSAPSVGPTAPGYPGPGNATVSTAKPPQFTGGAGRVVGEGLAVLAGAVGVMGLL